MSYENHINKFSDAAAIQAAIDNGDLLKPYVALDASAGTIDYNTRSVTPPVPPVPTMGEWSIDSDGHYTFTITETNPSYWTGGVQIGVFHGYTGNPDESEGWTEADIPIYFGHYHYPVDVFPEVDGDWGMLMAVDEYSEPNRFEEAEGEETGIKSVGFWGITPNPDVAESLTVNMVNYTLTFDPSEENITTINPPYPGSPSESGSGSGSGSESGSGSSQLEDPHYEED